MDLISMRAVAFVQMTEGHQYLLKNFGVQPRVGWQIDPFGHSGLHHCVLPLFDSPFELMMGVDPIVCAALTPTLFALMGFDAMVINRIHFQIKV